MTARYSCQCWRVTGQYGDGLPHYCYAAITGEDLLCDACRSGCTVLWLTQEDLTAGKALPFHVEYPRIAQDDDYLADLLRRAG